MALTLEVTLYNNQGESTEERLFGNIQAAKKWANEQEAEAIEVFDAESETETYYLRGGAEGSWYVSAEKLFQRRIGRLKEKANA